MSIIVVQDKDNKRLDLNIDWSRRQNKYFSSIHGISYYLAMFCPAMPAYFIDKYSKTGDLVMDNFSGRGTTALVAREKGRKFVGSDLNPYAYVLSRFKVSSIRKKNLINLIKKIRNEYMNSEYPCIQINKKDMKIQELLYFYSEQTYRQLLFLRNNYGSKWRTISPSGNALLAFALGLMHGPMKKNNDTIYFSLKMPNTISMSPNYVKNYSIKHKLIRPDVDIFEKLIERVEKKFDDLISKKYEGKVYYHDSTKINKQVEDGSVSLVITSPPYLNIVNYTRSNWLKLWLLGYDRKNLSSEIKLSDNLLFDNYVQFIKKYLDSIYPKLKEKAKICMIIGDIFEKSLIEEVWDRIKDVVQFDFVSLYIDNKYEQNRKATNMLKSKMGRATKIEKVLVLERK